jgi:hypothetical protein
MIVKWLESIKLSINASKSTFVMFDWRKRQRIPFYTPIKIMEVTVPQSKQANFLGLTLDPQLKLYSHRKQMQLGLKNNTRNSTISWIKLGSKQETTEIPVFLRH